MWAAEAFPSIDIIYHIDEVADICIAPGFSLALLEFGVMAKKRRKCRLSFDFCKFFTTSNLCNTYIYKRHCSYIVSNLTHIAAAFGENLKDF